MDRATYQKAYRAAHRDKARQATIEWRAVNGERRRAVDAKWREANRERVREATRRFAAAHPDRIRDNTARQRALRHIMPISRGGYHAMDNVQVSHPDCNRRKGRKWKP